MPAPFRNIDTSACFIIQEGCQAGSNIRAMRNSLIRLLSWPRSLMTSSVSPMSVGAGFRSSETRMDGPDDTDCGICGNGFLVLQLHFVLFVNCSWILYFTEGSNFRLSTARKTAIFSFFWPGNKLQL
ncbi:hypothetical protein F1542_03850 [Komagataeibacter sp. FXV3]|nr:hypothetical protein [Komagataeibacter sp. FXV3]